MDFFLYTIHNAIQCCVKKCMRSKQPWVKHSQYTSESMLYYKHGQWTTLSVYYKS